MGALSHAQLFAGIEQSYVFWDPFHLTETANSIVAKHML
jgi:phospholipase/lecithinase/hemolysin